MMYEVRAFGIPVGGIVAPTRSRRPSEGMRKMLVASIVNEADLQLETLARMQTLKDGGLSHSFEFKRLRLDYEWSKFRQDSAMAVEARAFGPTRETR
jgi:hypothetical protein